MSGGSFEPAYPIVCRFEDLRPEQLPGYEAHRLRKGGELSHVDPARSHLNRPLLGEVGWVNRALDEIDEMKVANFESELDGLRRRRRKKELQARILEGPRDPWRPSKHGPMREVILTANREWFDGDIDAFLGDPVNQRVDEFQACAISWLKFHFGADVIHARADLDETAYHIHAVIMPRAVVPVIHKGKTTGERRMLQPSVHPMIRDYEMAQTNVGAWFSSVGLVRGERRKEAWRQAVLVGETPEPKVQHKRCSTWRKEQDMARVKASEKNATKAGELERREAALGDREAHADAVMSVVEAVAQGDLDLGDSDTEYDLRTSEAVQPPESVAGKAAKRTLHIFHTAYTEMRRDARRQEREKLEQVFAGAFAGLRKALESIRLAEQHLPKPLRSVVTAMRETADKALNRAGKDVGRESYAETRTGSWGASTGRSKPDREGD